MHRIGQVKTAMVAFGRLLDGAEAIMQHNKMEKGKDKKDKHNKDKKDKKEKKSM